MHRMAAASFSESDLAGESHLASMRIESDLSTGGDRRKLQAQQEPNIGIARAKTSRTKSICRNDAASRW